MKVEQYLLNTGNSIPLSLIASEHGCKTNQTISTKPSAYSRPNNDDIARISN
jgi:hypothetical protein